VIIRNHVDAMRDARDHVTVSKLAADVGCLVRYFLTGPHVSSACRRSRISHARASRRRPNT